MSSSKAGDLRVVWVFECAYCGNTFEEREAAKVHRGDCQPDAQMIRAVYGALITDAVKQRISPEALANMGIDSDA